jgi:hypothetical protein
MNIPEGLQVLSFTGIADGLTMPQRRIITNQLIRYDPAQHAFAVGGAPGVDIEVALQGLHLGFHVHAVLPSAPYHPEGAVACTTHEVVAPGRNASESYMKRNSRLAEICYCMVAFPATNTERLRSGTWSTVRRARTLGRPVRIIALG